jgi:hypothetical protein
MRGTYLALVIITAHDILADEVESSFVALVIPRILVSSFLLEK